MKLKEERPGEYVAGESWPALALTLMMRAEGIASAPAPNAAAGEAADAVKGVER